MLACKKCHCELAEGTAQQSLQELEAALLVPNSPISAHRKAMKLGPLCDPCLAGWQEKHKAELQPAIIPDNRSPAMKRLSEACLALGKDSTSSE
jgi:hypothetical protein